MLYVKLKLQPKIRNNMDLVARKTFGFPYSVIKPDCLVSEAHVIIRIYNALLYTWHFWGWSGVAMVSCILRHRGVQLKLAYSWARPAILVAGKGRGGMFLFLLFLHFHSCSYFFPNRLFHFLYYLFYLFSPFLWETTQNDPQGLTCRSTPTQSINHMAFLRRKYRTI